MGDVVARAREFAVAAHGDQRYGDLPYSAHLDAVAALFARFGDHGDVVAFPPRGFADLSRPNPALQREFGDRVAAWVSLVTDQSGANRRERKARTNAKLAAVSGEDAVALVVKAADRLANLRASAGGGAGSKLDMYRREHPAFRAAAYRPGLCDGLWREMDSILGSPAEPGSAVDGPRL